MHSLISQKNRILMSIDPPVSGKLTWQKSRTCESGACVIVARQGESVLIGNSADPEGQVSVFTREEWRNFIAGIKLGDFDEIA
jgi:predicted secreted Zn-dependent protease